MLFRKTFPTRIASQNNRFGYCDYGTHYVVLGYEL